MGFLSVFRCKDRDSHAKDVVRRSVLDRKIWPLFSQGTAYGERIRVTKTQSELTDTCCVALVERASVYCWAVHVH